MNIFFQHDAQVYVDTFYLTMQPCVFGIFLAHLTTSLQPIVVTVCIRPRFSTCHVVKYKKWGNTVFETKVGGLCRSQEIQMQCDNYEVCTGARPRKVKKISGRSMVRRFILRGCHYFTKRAKQHNGTELTSEQRKESKVTPMAYPRKYSGCTVVLC